MTLDYAAIAIALRDVAAGLALDVEHGEELAARLPPTPGVAHSLADLKRRATLAGQAAEYFAAKANDQAQGASR